jgi:RPA family protein
MQASEMKYLRKVIGKTRRYQMRNTRIRNELKQESVEGLMEKRTLRWYGHAVRMDLERKPN